MGVCWGEADPDEDEDKNVWPVWETAEDTPVVVDGDANYGAAKIYSGTPAVSSVEDTGDTATKTFSVICPKYGTNTGNVTVSIRGSADSFGQHDGSPTWSVYSAPVTQAWRYVQLKLEYAT